MDMVEQELRDIIKAQCPGPAHKPFRLFVAAMLPRLRAVNRLVHVVEVMKTALRVAKASCGLRVDDAMVNDVTVPHASLVRVAFLRDVGWIQNGQEPDLSVPLWSLWLAQQHGVVLTAREYQAVACGIDAPAPLSMIIRFADQWVSARSL